MRKPEWPPGKVHMEEERSRGSLRQLVLNLGSFCPARGYLIVPGATLVVPTGREGLLVYHGLRPGQDASEYPI